MEVNYKKSKNIIYRHQTLLNVIRKMILEQKVVNMIN